VWSANGTGSFFPDNVSLNTTYIFSAADKINGSIAITLTSTGNGTCAAVSDGMVITINGPLVNAGADVSVIENHTITLNPVVTGIGLNYLWTPDLYLNSNNIKNPVVTGVADQLYTLKVTDATGCSNEDDVFVKVLKFPVIPNTFTPNNDGINDVWVIQNLADYIDCHIQVFDRYGQRVFESKGYTNPWDGTYKGRSIPFGTYYYIIEPGNGLKAITGYVTIIK
jgi:gliding motility-associated-like protein